MSARVKKKDKPSFASTREEQESWFTAAADRTKVEIDPLEKQWECDICNKSFTVAANLKRHKKTTHEDNPGFECDVCFRVFKESYSLKVHKRCVHEGIRNHECSFCGKKCSTKSCLKTHVLKNHTTTPLPKKDTKVACNECGQIFYHNGNLKRHIKTVHENKADYPCEICGRHFKASQSLKIHIKTIHEGRRDFPCAHCGKELGTRSGLRIHVKHSHHLPGCKIDECDGCKNTQTLAELKVRDVTVKQEIIDGEGVVKVEEMDQLSTKVECTSAATNSTISVQKKMGRKRTISTAPFPDSSAIRAIAPVAIAPVVKNKNSVVQIQAPSNVIIAPAGQVSSVGNFLIVPVSLLQPQVSQVRVLDCSNVRALSIQNAEVKVDPSESQPCPAPPRPVSRVCETNEEFFVGN